MSPPRHSLLAEAQAVTIIAAFFGEVCYPIMMFDVSTGAALCLDLLIPVFLTSHVQPPCSWVYVVAIYNRQSSLAPITLVHVSAPEHTVEVVRKLRPLREQDKSRHSFVYSLCRHIHYIG
jgi:hypothetical protein